MKLCSSKSMDSKLRQGFHISHLYHSDERVKCRALVTIREYKMKYLENKRVKHKETLFMFMRETLSYPNRNQHTVHESLRTLSCLRRGTPISLFS